MTHLPFALREALAAALGQRVPLSIDESGGLRTVGAVAQEIGVSREYLSRAAEAERIRLGAYLDACNALNALAEVEIEERSWSEVALCMGYPWQSGLTKLLKRGLGATPTSVRS